MREFIDIVETHLNEGGPSRIVTHIKNGSPFFILSACRADCSPEVNSKRSGVLRKALASLPGGSFIETEGSYHEDGQDDASREDSFFVLPRSDNTNMRKFHQVGEKLCKMFGQDAMLCGDGRSVFIYNGSNSYEEIGPTATFDPAVIDNLPGHVSVGGRKMAFTKPDVAPAGVVYGSGRQSA